MATKYLKLLVAGLTAASSLLTAHANSLYWDALLTGSNAGGGTGTWNLSSTPNWYNGTADVQWTDSSAIGNDSAIFPGTAGTVTLNTSLSASNLQFTTTGYTFTGSGTITNGAGGIDASLLTSGTTTIGVKLALPGLQRQWQVGAGGTLAINGAVTRSTGAGVDFTAVGVTTTTLANDPNGMIDGWATTGNYVASGTTGDFLSVSNGNIVICTNYLPVSPTANTTLSAAFANSNLVSGALNGANHITTVNANLTINSLVQQGDFGVNNGITLTIASGGLIQRGIARWLLDNNGGNIGTAVLQSGLASGELFIHSPDNAANAVNWRIWPQIHDNGATPTIVVKDGPGYVTLMNTNNYTGGTIINNGVLGLGGIAAPGTTAQVFFGTGNAWVNAGGILQPGNASSANVDYYYTNTIVLQGGKVLQCDSHNHFTGSLIVSNLGATFGSMYDGGGTSGTGNKQLFIDGILSGSGPVTLQESLDAGACNFNGNGGGNAFNSSVVAFSNNGNTYSGTVSLIPYSTGSGRGSYLALNGSNALQFATLNLTNNPGAQRYAASGGSNTALIFNTGLGSATLGAIAGTGNIILNGYREDTYALQADAIALTVGGNNASTTESGVILGTGSLTKTGSGTLALSAIETYTGNTTINGGTLALSGAWIPSTNITVAAGATLDVSALGGIICSNYQVLFGGGTINGSVTTVSGNKVYAGTDGGYGTNAITGSLTLAAGAAPYFDVGTAANLSNDLMTVGGTLTLNNTSVHIKAPSISASLQTADYVLFSAGAVSGSVNAAPVWDVQPVNSGNFSIVISGNQVKLHYSANSAPSGGGFATPSTVVGNQIVLLTILATNGVPGTVQTVTVDLSSMGGSSSFSLVRSNSSNVFTNSLPAPATAAPGNYVLPATITDSTPLSSLANIALAVTAAGEVWNGSGSDNNFGTGLNWVSTLAPAYAGDNLTFSGTTRLSPNLENNYSVTSVTFDATAGSFSLGSTGGKSLTFSGSAGLTNNSANTQTLTMPVVVNTLLVVTGANTVVTGPVTGGGSLYKQGPNNLTISANSAWGGNAASSGGLNGPFISQAGVLTFNNGSANSVTGELVIGGVVTNGSAGNNAKVVVDNSSLSVSTFTSVGRGNGVGTVSSDLVLTNGATVTSGAISLGYNGGNAGNLPAGTLTESGTTSFTITGNGAVNIGESAGSAMAMTLNNSAQFIAEGTAQKFLGEFGKGTVNLNDSSYLDFSGNGVVDVGYRSGTGTVNVASSAILSVGSDFRVGGSDVNGTGNNGYGTVNQYGGQINVSSLTLARGNNNQNGVSGEVNVYGGTFNNTNDTVVGYAGTGHAKLNVSGGTYNVGTTALKWLIMPYFDTTTAEVDVTNGNLNLNSGSFIRFSRGNTSTAGSPNVLNQEGGAVTFYSDFATTVGGSGALDMQYSGAATITNIYNLDGGTLTVPQIISSLTTATRMFNFNGGTLQAAASSSPFFGPTVVSMANVRNGGARINDGGFTVSIDAALVHSTIAGDNATDGGLIKSGAGALTLSGAETYNGNTVVSNGTLFLTGSLLTPNVLVENGATFDVSLISYTLGSGQSLSGWGTVNGTVTANSGSSIYGGTDGTYGTNTIANLTLNSGATVNLDLGTSAVLTNDQIVVPGGLTANNNAIHIKAPSTSAVLDSTTDYVLISAGSISGTFAGAPVWDVAPANAAHYSVVTSGTTVTLHYTSFSAPTATGFATPATALRNQNVLLTVHVTPGSGTVNPNGGVTVDLTPLGGSSLTLVESNTSNFFTNTTTIAATTAPGSYPLTASVVDSLSSSGTASIALSVAASTEVWNGAGSDQNWDTNPNWVGGNAPGLVGDSVTFAGSVGLAPNMDNNYTVGGITFSNNAGSFNIGSLTGNTLTLSGSGPIVNNSANPQTINVAVADSGGGVTKSGTGAVTLAAGNSYTGLTVVNNGTLTVSGSVGSTANTIVNNGTLNVSGSMGSGNLGNTIIGGTAGNSALGISGSAALAPFYMLVGNANNAVGAVSQTGGSVDISANSGYDNLSLGNVPGSFGYYNAVGGTLTVNGIAVAGEVNNGTTSSFGLAGNGIFEVRGGTVNDTGWFVIARNNNNTTGHEVGIVNVYGGSLCYNGGGLVGPWDTGESAIINILGGSVFTTNGAGVLLGNTGFLGTLNLNGGVLNAGTVAGYNGPNYTIVTSGILNFNGGTLQANGNTAPLIQVATATIYAGGATIDDNGTNVTTSTPLQAPTGNGVGAVSFTGGSGYIAPPIVTITNATGDTTGFGATAIAQINPNTGSVTNVIITCPGVNYTAVPIFVLSGGGATVPATITGLTLAANATTGGLTKIGTGTLTLSGANTYAGNTTISAGTLELGVASLPASGTVNIASSAKLQLDFTSTNQVAGLKLNGVSQPFGVYNSANAPTYITGSGSLVIASPVNTHPTNVIAQVTGGGTTLTLSWPADHTGWRLQVQTNALGAGLKPSPSAWSTVPGSASVNSVVLPLNPNNPTVFYRMVYP